VAPAGSRVAARAAKQGRRILCDDGGQQGRRKESG
jgi:hypothetical protein